MFTEMIQDVFRAFSPENKKQEKAAEEKPQIQANRMLYDERVESNDRYMPF